MSVRRSGDADELGGRVCLRGSTGEGISFAAGAISVMLVPLTGADPFAVAYDGDDIIICGAVLDSEDPESADIMLARLGPNGAPRWVTIRALHRIATPCSRLAIIFAQLLHGARGPPRPPPPGQLELLA